MNPQSFIGRMIAAGLAVCLIQTDVSGSTFQVSGFVSTWNVKLETRNAVLACPFASEALAARSVVLPRLMRLFSKLRPRIRLSALLSPSRLTHPVYSGQPGNPGRALSLRDPLEEWLPENLASELKKLVAVNPELEERPSISLREARYKLHDLIEKEWKSEAESAWLNHLLILNTDLHAHMLKRILEGRLVVGLTFEEAKELHRLLRGLETETDVTSSQSGKRLSVAFQHLPREFTLNPKVVDVSRRTYAIRRIGKISNGIIPLQIVPSSQIMGAMYEFNTQDLARGMEIRLASLYRDEPMTAHPEAAARIIIGMFNALNSYAENNGMAIQEVYRQVAACYGRIRIEIRKEGDHPEADLPWIQTPEGEKLNMQGTAVIIIPEKFIPAGDDDTAGIHLLHYIAFSEWAGHLLDPYSEDLTEDLKGVEPIALWHFIRKVGYQAVIETLSPHTEASEFARRVVVTLEAILKENPALQESPEVLKDAKARKALFVEQAKFLYSNRFHFEAIWGNGLLEKLAEESTLWISTPHGRRRRRTSLLKILDPAGYATVLPARIRTAA